MPYISTFLRRLAAFLAFLVLAGAALAQSPAAAAKAPRRLALVMGNDGYQHVSKLQKAGNDATAMARELKAAGFDVVLQRDLNYRAMVRAVEGFAGSVRAGDQVVVFFAGHGVQIRAGSYLLPVDIEATNESEIEKTAYGLNDLTDKLAGAKASFALVLVDACRDNPLRGNTGRSVGSTRGLSAIEPPRGQMVVYSASRGQQALDRLNDRDLNPNGVFTREFIARMRTPGVRVEDMVRDVQDSVETLARTIGHDQRPAIYNESRGSFYFFAPQPGREQPAVATQVPSQPPAQLAPVPVQPAATAVPAPGSEAIVALRRSANQGDVVAMLELGERLAAGNGVARNAREADNWYLKAASEGHPVAEFRLSDSFRKGDADYARDVQKILSLPAENRRAVAAKGGAAVQQLVASDPFFEVPAGTGKVEYTFSTNVRDHMGGFYGAPPPPRSVSCERQGRLAQVNYSYKLYGDYEASGQAFLGGLMPLKEKIGFGFAKSYATEVVEVRALQGQPFPLVPGRRFGMEFSRLNGYAGDETTTQSLSCVAEPAGAEGVPLLCLYRNSQVASRYFLARYLWNEANGCFVQRYESAGGQ